MDRLAGIVGKLDRGFEHLKEVEGQVANFFEDTPWAIAHKPDAEPGWLVATFDIKREPPLQLSIVAGEAVAQFHSSLDHLMTELAILRLPQIRRRPDRAPNFPIYPDPGEFWRPGRDGTRSAATRVGGEVRAEHFTELERLQPRNPEDLLDGDGHLTVARALAITRWINNLNKHATVRPAFFGPRRVGSHTDPNVAEFEWIYEPGMRLYPDTKLYRAKFVGEPEMGMPMTVEPDLSFGTRPFEWVTLGTIHACGEWVRWIVDRFRALTPEFGP